MKTKLYSIIAFVVLVGFMLTPQAWAFKKGETYYTKVNVWYETPERVYSTNYHKGDMMPVGTEVEMVKPKGKKIRVQRVDTGELLYIHHVKKYTQVSTEELLKRYFSKTSVLQGKEHKSFSALEKEAIKKGKLETGMSKDAVIMAYGYPPTHQTTSLKNDVWTFWHSRTVSFQIKFEGETLVKVK